MQIDKDKFDAVLRKLVNATPLPARQIKTKRTKVVDGKAAGANDK